MTVKVGTLAEMKFLTNEARLAFVARTKQTMDSGIQLIHWMSSTQICCGVTYDNHLWLHEKCGTVVSGLVTSG